MRQSCTSERVAKTPTSNNWPRPSFLNDARLKRRLSLLCVEEGKGRLYHPFAF